MKANIEDVPNGRTKCVSTYNSLNEKFWIPHNSDDCPKKPNGRKEGVMNITLRFWNDLGYECMGKTAQNLRDKSGHLEKITKAGSTQICPEIEIQEEEQRKTISRSGNNNQIANSDDLDNYERNTQETIEITTLLQEGINECTPNKRIPEYQLTCLRKIRN